MKNKGSSIKKDYIREIKNSKARFLSIFALVALGVFVLVGLTVAGPIIRTSLEDYIKKSKAYDIALSIPESFEDKDMRILEGVKGKLQEEYVRNIDLKDQDQGLNFHLKSLPKSMSLPLVVKGSLPKESGQILIDEQMQKKGYKLGQNITFEKEKDKYDPEAQNRLAIYQYKIVGFGKSIEFLDEASKGRSKEGGSIDAFAYILPRDFLDQSFQEYYVKFEDLSKEKTWSKSYKEKVKVHKKGMEDLLNQRPEERLQENLAEFYDKIREGRMDIAKGEKDLKEGKEELEKTKDDLAKAERDLAQAEDLLENGLLKGRREIAQGQRKLDIGQDEISQKEKALKEGQLALEEGKRQWQDQEKRFQVEEEGFLSNVNTFNLGYQAILQKSRDLMEEKVKIERALLALEEGDETEAKNPYKLPYSKEEINQSQANIVSYKEKIILANKDLAETQKELDKAKEVLKEKGEAPIEGQPQGPDNALIGPKKVQLEILKDQARDLESKIQDLTEEEKGKIEALKGQIRSLEEEIVALEKPKQKPVEPPTSQEERDKARYEVQILQAKVNQKQRLIQGYEDSIAKEKKKIQEQDRAISKSQEYLEEEKAKQEALNEEISRKRQELLGQKEQIEKAQMDLKGQEESLLPQKEALDAGSKTINEAKDRLYKAQAELSQKEEAFVLGQAQIQAGKRNLDQGKKDLDRARESLQREEARGREKIAKGKNDLEEGKILYREGKEEFDRIYPKTLRDIAQGKEDIEKAQGIVSVLKKPSYTISPRSESTMIYTLFDYAHRVDNLANIFPVFFFAVAMLLCSTTMNRMVEEHRISIGTYKALGYDNKKIAGKYVLYGALAALLGGLIGSLSGNYFLSRLIAKAYLSGFALPRLIVDFYPWQNILALGIGILATGLVAYLSVSSSLKQNAAELMRPKAPKHGQRIFLERLSFLWKRMGFFEKVTARNIFRYKKRMLMTLIGVMGCVALLVLGFGIQTSINGLVEKQFDQLTRFNMLVLHEKALDKEGFDKYKSQLKEDKRIQTSLPGRVEFATVNYPKGLDQKLIIIVPSQEKELGKLVSLRNRQSQEKIALKDTGVVITEKLADLLSINKGDTLRFKVEGEELNLPVNGITEGYAGHYLYMTKDLYTKAFEKDFKENMDLVKVKSSYENNLNEIGEDLTDNQAVLSILDLSAMKHTVSQLTASIGQIVLVILIASSLLAIVVLFTLTNINIQERKRELSTIKVLGFYPAEITTYIYRETGSLTLIGILLGFVVGKILHYNIMRIVVPDQAMLDPELTWLNYAIPGLITLSISLVVGLIVHRSLKKINMVEALKAVE